jgi:uncharacterized repeat protein (TIGR01451 family)
MSGIKYANPSQWKSRLIRFTIALLFALLPSLTLLGGVWAERSIPLFPSAGSKLNRMVPQGAPTPDAQQTSRGASPYPDNLPHQTSQAFAPEPAGSQVYINFDDVPGGTFITNRYPPAVFSTDPSHYTFARGDDYWGSSFPNNLDRGPFGFPVDTSGYAPLYVTFTSPVNNLRFYLLAVDELRSGIAQLNIFQNGSSTASATRSLNGRGTVLTPLLVDIGGPPSSGGMGYDNVTRIEIANITDIHGVAFDDFSFTIASTSSPTPTPTPSPGPLPPTHVAAEGHLEEITTVWELSNDATSYNVKRRASFEPSWTTIATGVQPITFTGFGKTYLTGRYRDNDAIPDVSYSYAITAVNSNGESAFSNVVSATIAPSCGDFETAQGPVQQPYLDRGNGWSLTANVSGADGLVLSDVSLKSRYMAKMMSVPYFVIKTSKMATQQRGELTQNSDASTMRVRLLRYSTPEGKSSSDGHVVETHFVAEYAVDRLTPISKSCLLITQDYSFNEKKDGDQCEPSASVPCSRFYPRVSYKFQGRAGETLESLNIAQRLHYRVDGSAENSIGLFRDCNSIPCLGPRLSFVTTSNPALVEKTYNVIKNGRDAGSWDNIHQTQFERVEEPPADPLNGVFGGCPDCVHVHWRWGDYFRNIPFSFPLAGVELIGRNPPLLSGPTNQDLDIGIVRYKAGEEHPTGDFKSLVNANESLRNLVGRTAGPRPRIGVIKPADVLYWYSGTSYEPDSDLFFKHGSWFNPDFHEQLTAPNPSGSAANSPEAVVDGVRSIKYGHVYKDGPTTFTIIDPSTMAPLPAGYAALDGRAHKVATDAIVSGPNVVSFDVPSINDQTAFNNLAIFHLERDRFDPDNLVWIEDTILPPDTSAPDFSNRIISARVNDVGFFVIGSLVQPQPDPGSSDLSVTLNDSPDPIVVDNNLTYVLHVSNSGPQTSTGVGVINALPEEAAFISVSSTQGTCKHEDGAVYCKLGTLPSGSSVDVTIVANTSEDKAGLRPEGRSIVNTAVVAGDNDDSNLDNNAVIGNTLLLPSSNARPSITITSPTSGATFTGPANTSLTAAAMDSDGSISQVDFYDGGTLIGTAAATGLANQYQRSLSPSFGPHTYVAVATDNGGRTNTSDPVTIFVNGAGSISITSPSAGSVFHLSANLTVTANATNPSGVISKVEFFANSTPLGEGLLAGASQYSVAWNGVTSGTYTLTAVLIDSSGVVTNSSPVSVTITNKPTVTILSPTDGMSYPLLPRVAVMATAQDSDGFVSKVDFYANGSLIGTGSSIGHDRFSVDWTQVPPGFYSLTAVATDNLGASTISVPINIGVSVPSPSAGEFIWFDDDVPAGAMKHTESEDWYWVDANPAALSGVKAHQSKNLGRVNPSNGIHKHYFDGAATTLPVSVGDRLFTYVFLDINNMPREIMLEWKDEGGWEHRAYWGENNINLGTDGANNRRYMGLMPKSGQWARLEVPASLVGLEGSTLNGMAFTLDGGRATWDSTGKATASAPPPPTTPFGDAVWFEDSPPAGAVSATVNDVWDWVANLGPYGLAHRSFISVNHNTPVYRSHSFTGAQTPMQVNPGDVLFTYVWMDPSAKPDQIMLQWYEGTGWEHRAFWGENFIGQQFRSLGVQGTESQRYMGGVPAAGAWFRLEVPASYVGLEGKSVSGMAFSVYGKEPTIAWDRSGKSSRLTTLPLPFSSTTGVWSLFSKTYGYAFETNDQGAPDHSPTKSSPSFYVYPNQAAGTVPMYRFRRPDSNNLEYFYSQSRSYDGNGWILDGTAFYVHPDATTPGTVPLYLYHDNQSHYFLTVDQGEAIGMTLDGIAAYVYPNSGLVPVPPSFFRWDGGCNLTWVDNSQNESGFEIQKDGGTWPLTLVPVTTVDANVTSLNICPLRPNFYVLRAFNSFGYSEGVGTCTQCAFSGPPAPANNPSSVNIVEPSNGAVVDHDFAITANAFDSEGNGTVAKVEFFANGNKLGGVPDPPYIFTWNNVPSGNYTLTAIVTDSAGAIITSNPVSVTVDSTPMISITSPANGAVLNTTSVTISASASDSDGSVSKVEFFQGSVKLGEITSAPFDLVWSNVVGGNYSLTAVATDNLGRTTVSSPVGITVNNPPNVSITTSSTQDVPTAPAQITIDADARDADGTISKVEFYQGTTLLASDVTSPYNYTWSNVGAGNYSVTAKATDSLGAVTTSNVVSILVNAKPSVSLTSPLSGNYFTAPALVSINASASDSDGAISRVEFYQGPTLISTVTSSPYTFNWGNVPAGTYTLSARAVDNVGASTASSSITITVTPNSLAIGKIAFASNRDGCAQIYLMNTDGTGQIRLTNDAANDESPKWSPDNSRIVFQSDRDFQSDSDNPIYGMDIYVMNWDGSAQTRLTYTAYDDVAPVWSPDGTKIAFQSTRNGVNSQIYIMNADGSGQVNVSNSSANDIQPAWSPDGTKIAFASDRDQPGFPSIYVMNANGTNQTRLTFSGSGFRDEQPAWSPDGMKLAFSSTRDSTVVAWQLDNLGQPKLLINKEIYVMNADGSAQVGLTYTPGTAFHTQWNRDSPAWSPDGTKITFRSDSARPCCDPYEQVCVMNADGSNGVNLSNSQFGDYSPSWSR